MFFRKVGQITHDHSPKATRKSDIGRESFTPTSIRRGACKRLNGGG